MNVENLRILARNAKVGDGCFWKHPESCNYNLVYTSTNREWLVYKAKLAGDKSSEVVLAREASSNKKGVYANSKSLYTLKIYANELFCEYVSKTNMRVLEEMSDIELAMWYLDDGCCIERRDHKSTRGVMSYRYTLCIGNFCEEDSKTEELFLAHMTERFESIIGNNAGRIVPNNSKATKRNRTWSMPVAVGKYLVSIARGFDVAGFENKLRARL